MRLGSIVGSPDEVDAQRPKVSYWRLNINSLRAPASIDQAQAELGAELPGDGAPAQLRRSGASPRVLLRACRPRQWSKNLLVFAAPCAAGVIDRPQIAARAVGAFLVMCMLSSATYLFNDVRDRVQDRQHPHKRYRPVAAGELSPRSALGLATALAVLGVSAAIAIAPGLALVGCGYLALTASYSLWLRRIAILDILIIAAGFVLRALAGGVATDIYLSRWFVIVTACCALYLVAAKRYVELREHSMSGPMRATLRHYSLSGLRLTLIGAATTASAAYAGWALTRPSHVGWYALSIFPLVLWLVRYTSLIETGAGEAPEELIMHDRVLLALGATWGLLFLGGVYAGS
ncbi:MAG TPA: decaprenyl-phosphate phosphoribosyltransferase [Solirubrobacteraceae bacterium]|nr:decaprenyl-phosphate phosphoribosyltransferase [Solirubrobacteraceae bacterium]